MRAKPFPPMLPWKRPTWVLVLLAMLVFGFYQKFAKVHLNHYAQTLSMYPEMDAVDAETRAAWWNELNQPKRVHYYILDGTWFFSCLTDCFFKRRGTSNAGRGWSSSTSWRELLCWCLR